MQNYDNYAIRINPQHEIRLVCGLPCCRPLFAVHSSCLEFTCLRCACDTFLLSITLPLCHFATLPRQKRSWNWLLAFNTRPQHPLTRLTWFKFKFLWIDNIILTSNLSSCTFLNLLDSALAAIDWLWIAILNLLVSFFLAPRTRQHSWHRIWTRAAACGGCTTCLGDREVQNGHHEKQKQKERERQMLEMLGETGQVWRIPNF